MHTHQASSRRLITMFVGSLLILQTAAPLAVQAHGGDDQDDGFGHGRGGVVPSSKTDGDMKAFRLSSAYGLVNGQPTGSGTFADADTPQTAVSNYVEGACVPVLVKATNQSNKQADVRLTLSYGYEARLQLGIDDLEMLTQSAAGNPETIVQNLNQLGTTGQHLSAATSFVADDGTTVQAVVRGPYGGDNAGKEKAWDFNGHRHYNVSLLDVPAGRTVSLLSCARISSDEGSQKRRKNHSKEVDPDFLKIALRLGGHTEDRALIGAQSTLLLPQLTLATQVHAENVAPSDFGFHVEPPINGQSDFDIPAFRNSVIIEHVPPEASYVITQTGPVGYVFSEGSGTNCTFSGDTATAAPAPGLPPLDAICEFTIGEAPPPEARLAVTTVVINDNGGTKTAVDFPLFVNGDTVANGFQNTYAPGLYQVSETTSSEYAVSFSGDCDASGNVTLNPGDVKACTVTNNDMTAMLTVTTIVVNDNGGMKTIQDFPLFVNGEAATSGVPVVLGPGTAVVTEQADAGYQPTFSGDCDADGNVTLALGQAKYCVVTNNDKAPTLTVTTVVVNDNGGTKTAVDFPLFVNGNAVASGDITTLTPSTAIVSELTDPGYEAIFSGDCDENGNVVLALGDAKSCVITNDDAPPPPTDATLTIHQVMVNDNGGIKTVADFQVYLGADPVAAETELTLAPGIYVVNERPDPYYTETYSGDCSPSGQITLAAGEHKTCTITNNDASAGLTVVTHVINNNSGTLQASDFTMFVQAVGNPAVFPGSEDGVTLQIGGGAFGVGQSFQTTYQEPVFEGTCFGFINPGDALVCTITNDDF